MLRRNQANRDDNKVAQIKRQIETRHSIKGRLRYKIRGLRDTPSLGSELEKHLTQWSGVVWTRVSPKSASLVVRYDPELTDSLTITAKLKDLLTAASDGPWQAKTCSASCCRAAASTGPRLPGARSFIGLTCFVGYQLVKKHLLGRLVAQTMFSPVGLVAASFAVPVLYSGIKRMKNGGFSLEIFIGGGALAAVGAGEAFTALEILWINSGASLLESWIADRSRRAISDILEITAQNTFILVDGVEVETPVSSVGCGDTVVLHTGEKISVDGPILRGEALVDESPINGRSEPMMRRQGDPVYAGTIIREGLLYVKAECVGDQTYLARIMKLVQDSLENKASLELAADRLARRLVVWSAVVPLGVLLATGSFWRSFTVFLVLACPCATALAASTAVSAAINRAARQQILIKGGRYLEEFSRMDTICFDKTGTLTSNRPVLVETVPLTNLTEDRMLELAYSTERHQKHPMALALIREAENRGLAPQKHVVCEYHLGEGVRAELSGKNIFIGSRKLMKRYGISTDQAASEAERVRDNGLTVLYLAEEKDLLGLFALANQIRPEVNPVLRYLAGDGIKSMAVVTGDEEESTRPLAERLGFSRYFASVLPEEKAEIVRMIQSENQKVMMVGDGINDALALSEADVGVAMGAGGAEAAIEAADVALVKDDLTGLVFVHSLSRTTQRVIKQNFWIAHGSNLAGVALGALGLMSPVSAGLLHILHTLGILANSSRLLTYQPDRLEYDRQDRKAVTPEP